ncbi:MAG TPA: hypothetical protein VK543_06285 [Puia sp.]|nr:hypothetical protein [Puia sp.]
MKADNSGSGTKEKQLTGKVVLKKFAPGSKSEHDAVYLECGEGSFVLRRMGGNPFHDPELHKLVGKQITATGIVNQSLFLAKDIQPH